MSDRKVLAIILIVANVIFLCGVTLLLAYHPTTYTRVERGCIVEMESDMAGSRVVERVCP